MFFIDVNYLRSNGGFMKKIFIALCLLPVFAVANETGESCSKLEDSGKRLECYDSAFKADEQSVKTDIQNWQYIEKMDEMRNKSYFDGLKGLYDGKPTSTMGKKNVQ